MDTLLKNILEDSVQVSLLNEKTLSEWEIVYGYLQNNLYIDNKEASELVNIVQTHEMSRLFSKWLQQGLIKVFNSKNKAPRYTKYTLPNKNDI